MHVSSRLYLENSAKSSYCKAYVFHHIPQIMSMDVARMQGYHCHYDHCQKHTN